VVFRAQTGRESNESAFVLISVDSSTLETDPVDFCLPQSPAHEGASRLQIPTATEAENTREIAVSLQQLQWIPQWIVNATPQQQQQRFANLQVRPPPRQPPLDEIHFPNNQQSSSPPLDRQISVRATRSPNHVSFVATLTAAVPRRALPAGGSDVGFGPSSAAAGDVRWCLLSLAVRLQPNHLVLVISANCLREFPENLAHNHHELSALRARHSDDNLTNAFAI
jgi:hypothetical protein